MDIQPVIQDSIQPIIVAICFCVGYILKHTKKNNVDNKYIPLIVGVFGVMINVWQNNWVLTPEILLGGLVSGLASTGIWEAIRNTTGIK
jgi:hypothetical protein